MGLNLELENTRPLEMGVLILAPQGGNLAAVWDRKNSQGGRSASGLYFWRLVIGEQVETGRMMLIE